MRLGETLSLTVTRPNEQRIKVCEAVVRWSRGEEFGAATVEVLEHTQARLTRFVQRHRRASTIPRWQGGIELLLAAGE